MIETRFFDASPGARAGARIAGSSGPALIFVHGVGSTAAIWDKQLEYFASGYRCAAIELRGNGIPKPEPDPSLITREGYAQDVLAAADALGIERFTIVGCSLGGVVAFELWKTVPQRIEAMVLVGTFARYPDAQAYADRIAGAARAAGSMGAFAQSRAAALGLPPERTAETVAQMACKTLPSYLAATQATWTGDYLSVLPTIAVPALVCCGERDTVAPKQLSEEIASRIRGAKLHVIEDAGHVTNADAPDAFNALVGSFATAQVPHG